MLRPGRSTQPNLGAQQQICECAAAGVPQRPQPPDEQRGSVEQVGEVAGQQPPRMPTAAPSRRTTLIPNSARPRLHPVMAGNSSRLTAIQQNDHSGGDHVHQPEPARLRNGGRQYASSASTAITPMPSSTSNEKAPARAGQDASGWPDVRVVGRAVAASRREQPSRRDLFDLVDPVLARVVRVMRHPHPQPVALFLVGESELVTLVRTATSTSTDPLSLCRSTAARISDTWTLTFAAW